MLNKAFSIISCAALSALMLVPTQQADAAPRHQSSHAASFGRLFGGTNTGWRAPLLGKTKCWKFTSAFPGKPGFMELQFFGNRRGHSMVSGTVVRADAPGSKPDRVIQISGSMSYHEFEAADGTLVPRYLMNVTSSLAPTGAANGVDHYSDKGFYLNGHYHIRLDPFTLDGVFGGRDVISRWTAGQLTGPAQLFDEDNTVTGGSGITANYMGGINCTGGECGAIVPVNQAGSLELVGTTRRQCDNARNSFPL